MDGRKMALLICQQCRRAMPAPGPLCRECNSRLRAHLLKTGLVIGFVVSLVVVAIYSGFG
jgi:predicted amidophosphoribosyltransferase